MADKLKLGFYWAASCGGCEIAVLEIAEKILDVIKVADVVFWPCIADFKYHHVESYPDDYIDICLFNGAIRSTENEHVAHLLRKKSKVLVAYGSCSHEGCIPALANLKSLDEIFHRAYIESPSTVNPDKIIPQLKTTVPEGEVELPRLYNSVLSLGDVTEVDYFVPGCPPTEKQTWNVISAAVAAFTQGATLPPGGSVIGCGTKSVCDECKKEKKLTKIPRFTRRHLEHPDPTRCMLEQGIICMGPATRSGCEARCLDADMPCRGCYGANEDSIDQGAGMIGALGALIDSEDPQRSADIMSEVVDPAGTFYRFSMAKSMLKRRRVI